jgi:hypothetical protein
MTREEAIKLIDTHTVCFYNEIDSPTLQALHLAIEALKEVQKHEETFEWCHDCKEYDTENYCCHRWSKVIRNTVEELKEEPPTIPCFTESAEAYKAWTGEEMGCKSFTADEWYHNTFKEED